MSTSASPWNTGITTNTLAAQVGQAVTIHNISRLLRADVIGPEYDLAM